MEFGVCGGFEIARPAAEAGYDYFEMTVGNLLKPLEDEAAFAASLARLRQEPLPCKALNVFIPADLKITGPQVDPQALQRYVTTACRRAETAGVSTIVFGSGGARRIPQGFPRASAWKQLVDFCSMLGPVAAAHGVTIAIEPLNQAECNVINTVREGAALALQVNHPAIRLLVDAYHWEKDQDSIQDLVDSGPLLAHAHIATVKNRLAPGAEAHDFQPFFQALLRSGYQGRLSIEARLDAPQSELPLALDVLRRFCL